MLENTQFSLKDKLPVENGIGLNRFTALVESLDKEDKRKNRKRYKVVNKEAVMAAKRTAFEYLNNELEGKGVYRKLYKLVTWII